MPYTLQLPNGALVQDVPDDASASDLKEIGYNVGGIERPAGIARTVAQGAAEGLTSGLGSAAQGVGELANIIQGDHEPDLSLTSSIMNALHNQINGGPDKTVTPELSQSNIFTGGKLLGDLGRAIGPNDIAKQENPISATVGETLGGIAPYTLDPALGIPLFGAQSAGNEAQTARAAGASPDEIKKATLEGAEVGAAEGLVLNHLPFMKSFEQASPGFAPWITAKLKQAAASGIGFTGVGEAQDWLSKQIEHEYNPEAEYKLDPVRAASSMITGGILGAIPGPHPAEAKETKPEDITPPPPPPPPPAGLPAGDNIKGHEFIDAEGTRQYVRDMTPEKTTLLSEHGEITELPTIDALAQIHGTASPEKPAPAETPETRPDMPVAQPAKVNPEAERISHLRDQAADAWRNMPTLETAHAEAAVPQEKPIYNTLEIQPKETNNASVTPTEIPAPRIENKPADVRQATIKSDIAAVQPETVPASAAENINSSRMEGLPATEPLRPESSAGVRPTDIKAEEKIPSFLKLKEEASGTRPEEKTAIENTGKAEEEVAQPPAERRSSEPVLDLAKAEPIADNLSAIPAEKFTEHEQDLVDAVNREVARLFPGTKAEPYKTLIGTDKSGKPTTVHGAHFTRVEPEGVKHIIAYALDSSNPIATARHEGVHWMRRSGIITPKEWKTLTDAANKEGWHATHQIPERYADLPVDHETENSQNEEAIAEHLGAIHRGEVKATGPVKRIADKIKNFLDRVKTHAQKILGKEATADDIIKGIERGDVGKRKPNVTGIPEVPESIQRQLQVQEKNIASFQREQIKRENERDAGVPPEERLDNASHTIDNVIKSSRDLGFLGGFDAPYWVAQKFPRIAKIYASHKAIGARSREYNNADAQAAMPFLKLPMVSQKRVGDYMHATIGDPIAEIREEKGVYGKLTPDEVTAVKSMRQIFDAVPARFMKAAAKKAGVDVDALRPNDLNGLKTMLADALEKLKAKEEDPLRLQDIESAISTIEDFPIVTNYFPDMRIGDYWVNVKDADGKTVFNDQVMGKTFLDKIKHPFISTVGRAPKDLWGHVRNNYPESQGFKYDSGYTRERNNPSAIGLDPRTISKLLDTAHQKITVGEDNIDITDMMPALHSLIADLGKYRTPSFLKERKGVARLPNKPYGDMLSTYLNMVSNIPSRIEYQQQYEDAVRGIDKMAPKEREYARKLIEYTESQENQLLNNLRSVTYYTSFPFKLSTPIANFMTTHLVGAPELGKITNPALAHAKLAKYEPLVLSAAKYGKEGVDLNVDKLRGKISDAAYQALKKSPDVQPHLNTEMSGHSQFPTFASNVTAQAYSGWKTAAQHVNSMMGFSEQAGRASMFLAAFDSLHNNKKAQDSFMKLYGDNPVYKEQAKNEGGIGSVESMTNFLVQRTFGDAGKFNRANWERGNLALFAQFRKWNYHLTRLIADGFKQPGAGPKMASLLTLATTAAAAGITGLPFMDDADRLIKSFAPDLDMKTAMQQFLTEDLGINNYGTDFIMNGGFHATPYLPNIGKQFSLSDELPNSMALSELGGATFATSVGKLTSAYNRYKSGQPRGAFADFVGSWPGIGYTASNALKAASVWPNEGVRTQYGAQVVPPGAIPAEDTYGAPFGFQPKQIETAYQQQGGIKALAQAGKKDSEQFHRTFADLLNKQLSAQEKGDSGTAASLQQDMDNMVADYEKMMEDPKVPQEDKFKFDPKTVKSHLLEIQHPDIHQIKALPKRSREQGLDIQKAYGN